MITAAKILDQGGAVRKGNASTQAERQVKGGTAYIPDGSLGMPRSPNNRAADNLIQQLLMEELVQGKDEYSMPHIVSWGSNDCEFIRLDCMWDFPQFIILQKIHTPSVPAFGEEWAEYVCIPFSDTRGITEFTQRAGLNGPDQVEP